ncbi:MAG: hypothetical protein HQ495_08270 [Alphaproteobacteria bacterium]|nr:hypothetical protein [Alphaproteobacteria bacterium]
MPLYDVYLLLIAAAVAGVFLWLGYTLGDKEMAKRHSVTLAPGRQMSGALPEFVILLSAALLVALLDAMTDDVSIRQTFGADWRFVVLAIAGILGVVTVYANTEIDEAAAASKEAAQRLRRAYFAYNVYSTIIFALGAAAVVIVVTQYIADKHAVQMLGQEANEHLKEASGLLIADSKRAPLHFEQAYAVIQRAGLKMSAQLVPAFALVLALIAINFLIEMTHISRVFTPAARKATRYLSLAAVVGVLGAAVITFVATFSRMVGDAAARLAALSDLAQSQSAEGYRRYVEILIELERSQGVSGFYRLILGDTLAVVVTLAGLALSAAPMWKKKEEFER